MHLNTCSRIVSNALHTLTGALVCGLLLSSTAHAAGLGKLTVLSSLGQPLRAEIELAAVSNSEAGALVAKLAPADAYRVANIDFNPTLLALRFAVEQRSGRHFIQITSSQPVNEPFVDMLLELSWDSGRLVREYTFLLDPADMRQTQSAQVAAPAQGAFARMPAEAQSGAAQRVLPPPTRSRRPAESAGSQYSVKPGDTLGRIAARLKPTDVSLDLMLVALYRANPEAFGGNNMNRLRSGRILAVPDAAAILAASSDGQAKAMVVAHALDFNSYRNKLAGQVALSTPAKAPETGQSAAGKISAKVEEHATLANESQDQLKLSKAAPAAAGTSAATEERIAKDQQIADATARVKELEKNVSDLEKLMGVKNKALQAEKKPVAAVAATWLLPTAKSSGAAAGAAKRPVPPPKAAPAPTWIDMLSDNINAIGIALAALLAGAAFILSRRRKQALPKTEPSISGELGAPAHSLFAETGGQSVDTNNSVFNSNFAPSASQLDTNEVDPVAEADVYIAYGRDVQAEEILKEALRAHPERHLVRLKLLEIYAARKDARAFETQAGELYSLTKGSGDEWTQAAALGLSIDPQNALYAGLATAAAPPPAQDLGRADALPEALVASAALSGPDLIADSAPLEQHGMEFDLEPAPALAAPIAAPAAPEVADNVLDFDLDGFGFEPIVAMPALETPVPALETPVPALVAAEPVIAPEPSLAMDLASVDAMAPPVQPAAPAQDDASIDFDFDLPAEFSLASPSHAPEAPAAALPPDLDMMQFEPTPTLAVAADKLGDDFAPMPEVAAAPKLEAAGAPEFDLSDIDLDLSTANVASPDDLEGVPNDVKLSAMQMEMDTKLDLAIAYQEIGDKEGARELIDEVIKGGSDDQVAKANIMRLELA